MTLPNLEIIYEDDYCLAINKPPNMLVHHSYSSRNLSETQSLMEYLSQNDITAFPIHRLDYKTSGVLLLSKKKEQVSAFQALFENQTISKKYTALVRGFVDEKGSIATPVKNEKGQYKEALTHFALVKTLHLNFNIKPYPTARYSIVHLFPKTGRTHQLRIHANKISHPIIGDPRYGNRHHNHYFSDQLGIPYLFLHAYELNFIHPFNQKSIEIQAQFPFFWEKFEQLARASYLA
jgi:tRNA pseudouridine65 synthase